MPSPRNRGATIPPGGRLLKWRRRLFACVLATAMLAAAGGCERKEPATRADHDGNNVNALRSLPYAGGTPASGDEQTGVVFRDPERSWPGYTLYTVQSLSMAELIDEDGAVVHGWSYSPSDRWERGELLPNGDLLAIGVDPYAWSDGGPSFRIPDESRYIMRLSWHGNVLWKRKMHAHHDVELTPDGHLLVPTFERRSVPEINAQVKVRDDELTLLDELGNTIESVSMLDAVRRNPKAFPLRPVSPSTLGGPPWVDLFHCNSVEWMYHENLFDQNPLYAPDNILLCYRHQDRIAVFNWTSKMFVWSWGAGKISGPHDAQMLASGHILLFDNGLGRGRSRAIEMDPTTGEIVWQYVADPPSAFYTATKGSVQRLPNGNTLMAESDQGRAIEVTPDGDIVWKFVCPHRESSEDRAAIVRVTRYPHDVIDRIIKEQEG